MPRVMRRALLAPLALSCFAHAATPRAASRDIGSASATRSAGSAGACARALHHCSRAQCCAVTDVVACSPQRVPTTPPSRLRGTAGAKAEAWCRARCRGAWPRRRRTTAARPTRWYRRRRSTSSRACPVFAIAARLRVLTRVRYPFCKPQADLHGRRAAPGRARAGRRFVRPPALHRHLRGRRALFPQRHRCAAAAMPRRLLASEH